jgi:hypothetical protein
LKKYITLVLAYYKSEWTDMPNDDQERGIALTKDLRSIISNCFFARHPIPNAAKEVKIFLDLLSARGDAPPTGPDESECGSFDK